MGYGNVHFMNIWKATLFMEIVIHVGSQVANSHELSRKNPHQYHQSPIHPVVTSQARGQRRRPTRCLTRMFAGHRVNPGEAGMFGACAAVSSAGSSA